MGASGFRFGSGRGSVLLGHELQVRRGTTVPPALEEKVEELRRSEAPNCAVCAVTSWASRSCPAAALPTRSSTSSTSSTRRSMTSLTTTTSTRWKPSETLVSRKHHVFLQYLNMEPPETRVCRIRTVTTFSKWPRRLSPDRLSGFVDMVVSGVPRENGILHAAEVASMALDLVGVCGSFRIPHKPNTQLQIRAGIHSGTLHPHEHVSTGTFWTGGRR